MKNSAQLVGFFAVGAVLGWIAFQTSHWKVESPDHYMDGYRDGFHDGRQMPWESTIQISNSTAEPVTVSIPFRDATNGRMITVPAHTAYELPIPKP